MTIPTVVFRDAIFMNTALFDTLNDAEIEFSASLADVSFSWCLLADFSPQLRGLSCCCIMNLLHHDLRLFCA